MADALKVLILNASLKHGESPSNTEEVADMVVEKMRAHAEIDAESIRLSDKNIPVGLSYKMSEDDEWPGIVEEILAADIILFATPIWWGSRSSLMQRVIERMDAFDEDYIKDGRSALLNKVAGIVITGSEDGLWKYFHSLISLCHRIAARTGWARQVWIQRQMVNAVGQARLFHIWQRRRRKISYTMRSY
jgi:multimeric flavodoxin WrbA